MDRKWSPGGLPWIGSGAGAMALPPKPEHHQGPGSKGGDYGGGDAAMMLRQGTPLETPHQR